MPAMRMCKGRLAMRTIRDLVVKVSPVTIRPSRRRETITRSTLVLRTDTLGRTMWVDIGWQACDERLVSVAEAKALGGRRAAFGVQPRRRG
jgi:hypothetical protein